MRANISGASRRARALGFVLGSGLLMTGWTQATHAGDISGGSEGLYANVPGATGMTVAGPRGFAATSESDSIWPGQSLPNGSYRYEIYGDVPVSEDSLDAKRGMNNGRGPDAEKQRGKWGSGVIASGHFRIKNGQVFEPGNEKEE